MPDTSASFAPGRVNLIGEHIDYHGLPVLPMALRRGIRIVFRRREDGIVRLTNRDPAFGAREFRLAPDLEPGPAGDWGNYAMAAAVTVVERYGATVGFEGELTSDLPAAAGLSSSSALVVAVAQAILAASGLDADPIDLAQALAEGERFVGTAGGGMDQAASLNGLEGHALLVSFGPLRVRPIPLPDDWTVVVGHSGVSAEKSGTSQEAYNVRRAEGGAALGELAARLGAGGRSPAELLARFELPALLDLCERMATRGGRWAGHVLSESTRVTAAVEALRASDLASFGELLTASHASLRDVYEVSHPRLDALVQAAERAGAAGARLTGAGFGGCMLAVTRRDRTEAVITALREAQREMDPVPALAPFVAGAGPGARVERR